MIRLIILITATFSIGFVAALVCVQQYIIPTLHAEVVVEDFDKGTVTISYEDLTGQLQKAEVDATVGLRLPERANVYGKRER